ncbi:MAG: hypothetical protein ACLPWF_16260 [Bryobacteraceae bacterium]
MDNLVIWVTGIFLALVVLGYFNHRLNEIERAIESIAREIALAKHRQS